MQCPDCHQLRHKGECKAHSRACGCWECEDPDELEMALAFNELERERLIAAQAARAKEKEATR